MKVKHLCEMGLMPFRGLDIRKPLSPCINLWCIGSFPNMLEASQNGIIFFWIQRAH